MISTIKKASYIDWYKLKLTFQNTLSNWKKVLEEWVVDFEDIVKEDRLLKRIKDIKVFQNFFLEDGITIAWDLSNDQIFDLCPDVLYNLYLKQKNNIPNIIDIVQFYNNSWNLFVKCSNNEIRYINIYWYNAIEKLNWIKDYNVDTKKYIEYNFTSSDYRKKIYKTEDIILKKWIWKTFSIKDVFEITPIDFFNNSFVI